MIDQSNINISKNPLLKTIITILKKFMFRWSIIFTSSVLRSTLYGYISKLSFCYGVTFFYGFLPKNIFP